MTTIRKPFFVVPLDLGEIVCGNALSGNSVDNLGRHNAVALTWKTNGNTNLWARGDFGSAQPVDFMTLIQANALPGTTIRLRLGSTQAEVDGIAPYDSGALSLISPAITRDDGLYHSHLEISSVQTYRWWRIDIGGHTGDFEASSLVLGTRIEPSRYYNFDFEYSVKDLGDLSFGRFGVFDETPGAILRQVDFTLAWQSEAEFEASFRPMIEKLGRRGIVYCCFDPEATTYRQARTYMGVFDKPPFARGIRKPRTFQQDYAIVSLI